MALDHDELALLQDAVFTIVINCSVSYFGDDMESQHALNEVVVSENVIKR
jgi:hypothetical protein